MDDLRDVLTFRPHEAGYCERCGKYRDELYLATLSSGGQTESMAMCPECAMRLKTRVDQRNARTAAQQPQPVRYAPPVQPQSAPVQPQPIDANAYAPYPGYGQQITPTGTTPNMPTDPNLPAKKTGQKLFWLVPVAAFVLVIAILIGIAPGAKKISKGEAEDLLMGFFEGENMTDFESYFHASSKFDSLRNWYPWIEQYDCYDFIDKMKKENPDEWAQASEEWDNQFKNSQSIFSNDVRITINSITPLSKEEIEEYYENAVSNYANAQTYFKLKEIKGICRGEFTICGTIDGEYVDREGTCTFSCENGKWRHVLKDLYAL